MATKGPVAPVIFQADQLRSQLDDLGVTDPGFRDFLFRKLIAEKPDYAQGTQTVKQEVIKAFKQIQAPKKPETIGTDLGGAFNSLVHGNGEEARKNLGKAGQKAATEFGRGTSESTVGQLSQMAAGVAPEQNDGPEGFGEALVRTAGTLVGDAPLFAVGGAGGRTVGGLIAKTPLGKSATRMLLRNPAADALARPVLGIGEAASPVLGPASFGAKKSAVKAVNKLAEEAVTSGGAFAVQQAAAQPVQLEAQARALEAALTENQRQIELADQAIAVRRKAYDQAIKDGRPKAELDSLHAETIAPLEHEQTKRVAQSVVWGREIEQLRAKRLASAGEGFGQGLVTGGFSGLAGVAGGTAAKGVGAFSKARVLPQGLAVNTARGGAGVLAETEGEVQLNAAYDPTVDVNAERAAELMGFGAYRATQAGAGAIARAPGAVVRGIGKATEGVKPGDRTLNANKDTAPPGQPKGLLVNLNEPMAGGRPVIQTEAPQGTPGFVEMPSTVSAPPVAPAPASEAPPAARALPTSQPVILNPEGGPAPADAGLVLPSEPAQASLIANLPEAQIDALLARSNTLSRADLNAAVEAKQRFLAERPAVQTAADQAPSDAPLIVPPTEQAARPPVVEPAPVEQPAPSKPTVAATLETAKANTPVQTATPANPYLNAKDLEVVRQAANQGVRLAQEALPVLEARAAEVANVRPQEGVSPEAVAGAAPATVATPPKRFSDLVRAKKERDAQAAKPKKLSEIVKARRAAKTPAPTSDRDTFSITRPQPDGLDIVHTFRRGDRVRVWFSKDRSAEGTITGISHATGKARVVSDGAVREGGVEYEFGRIYPAETKAPAAPQADIAPMSKVVEQANAKHEPPGGFTEADTATTTPSIFGEIAETKHTQKGHALFVVPVQQRVDRARFDELLKVAKSMGGYYSAFRKTGAVPGFQFKSREEAERFRVHQAGAPASGGTAQAAASSPDEASVPESTPQPRKTHAVKLRDQADKIQAKAEEEASRDRKTNTHKRAAEAAHALKRAERERALGATMRNLADAQEEGSAQHLNQVSTKSHVEALETALRDGMYETRRREGSMSREREPEISDVERARYPYPAPHRDWVMSVVRAAEGKKGLASLAKRVQARLRGDDARPRFTSQEDVKLLEDFVSAAEKAGIARFDVGNIRDTLKAYRRMQAMGITNEAQLREALREYFPLRDGRRAEDPIKKAERELVGTKIPGYFPTPPELANRMVEEADIRDGMSVLEPSAGKGNLVEAVARAGRKDVSIDALEVNHTLRGILEAKKQATVIGQDFIGLDPEKTYDRIIMNPPFENGQDILHVRRAFDHLKPGGRLVAIMGEGAFGRSDKQATEFRAWLEEVGGTSEKNPDGIFKSAERPTGVATRMVVIDKPAERVAAERSGEPQKGISPKEKFRSLGPDEDPGQAILDLERRAAANNQIKEAIGIGRVSEHLADTVMQDVGLDVSGYEHIVTVDGLNHIRNSHTDPDIERGHQQVPITEADLARIPEVVRDFDQVEYFDKNDKPTRDPEQVAVIRYAKRVNGHYFYFEEIRTGRQKLAAKTFYKKAAKKEGPPSAPMADENPSIPGRPTSKTDSEQPSSDTVTPGPLAFKSEKEAIERAKALTEETGLLHQVRQNPEAPGYLVDQTQVEGDRLPNKGAIPDSPMRDPIKQPRANSRNAEANRARLLEEIDQEIANLDQTEAEVINRLSKQVDEARQKPSQARARQAKEAQKDLDKARESAEMATFTLGRATFRVPRLPDTLRTFRDRISKLSKAALDVLHNESGEFTAEGALSAILAPVVAALKAIGVAVDLAKGAAKQDPVAQAPSKNTNFRRQPPKSGVPLMQSAKGALLKTLQAAGAVDRKANEISRATFEKVLPGLEVKGGELAVGRKGFEGLTWLTKEAKTGNDLVDGGLEALRKGLIDKYGLTEDEIKTLNAGRLEKIRIAIEGMDYVRLLSDLSPEDSRVVNAILTDAEMDPGEWEALSEPIRNAVTRLGEEMVEVGLISREAFERNRGQYLHASYERHLTTRPLPAFFFKKIKLLGDELRLSGRTLEGRTQADWEELTRNWEVVERNDQVETAADGQERNRGTAVIRDKESGRTLTVPIEGGKARLGLDDYLARDWEIIGGKAQTVSRAFDPSFADAIAQDWEPVGDEHPEQFWSKEKDRVLLRNVATGEEVSVHPREAKNYLADWKVEGEKDGKTILSHQPKLLLRRRWSGDEKAMLGYVEDVGFNVARTYDLIANDLATFKMFKALAAMPESVSQERAADMDKEEAKKLEAKGWVLFEDTPLKGSSVKKWGELAGRYVSPHMARHLKEMDRLSQPGPWKWLMSQWKLNKTSRSPVTHMNNVVANVALLNFAGADLRDLADVFEEIGKGEASEILRAARSHGVFDSDFITAELRRHQPGSVAEKRETVPTFKGLGDELRAAVDRKGGDYALFRSLGKEMQEALNQVADKGIGTLEAAWVLVKRGDQFMQDMYQFEDLIFRLAVFKNRVDSGMTPEAAAGEARKWFLDYDIDAPWVNRARETLLPFAAWPYRAVPRVIESAMTRPWIWGKYVVLSAGLSALGMLGVGMAGHEAEKMVLSPHMQGGKAFPNAYRVPGPKNADGESLWLDASRWRLLGDVVDMGEGKNSAIPFLPQALMPSGPLASLAGWIANRDLFTWKPIDDEAKGLPWGENIAKWAYAQIAPNAPWVPMSPSWNKWTAAKDGLNLAGGEESSLPLALMSGAGIKLSPISLKRAKAQVWKFTTLAQQADAVVRAEAFKLRNGATTPEQYRRAADAARAVNLKQIELALEYARRFEKLQGKQADAEATLPTQERVASAIVERAKTAGTVAAVAGGDMMAERARLEAELKKLGVSPQVMGAALNAYKGQFRGSTRARLKEEAKIQNFRGGLLGGLD